MSTFGRQNRTNTGVAPAQIEVFVHGLFSDHQSRKRFVGKPLSRLAAEREGYVSTRTLRVFLCSGFGYWPEGLVVTGFLRGSGRRRRRERS